MPTDYAGLDRCGRPVFAWEWLRRRARYQLAWREHRPGCECDFGLHQLVDPELDWRTARPLWCASADPFVLTTAAVRVDSSLDTFDVDICSCPAVHKDEAKIEHWLFSNGPHSLRLDVFGTLQRGPVHLVHRIEGLERARPAALTLNRLIALARHRCLIAGQFPPEARASRWALALRVHDALSEQTPQSEIGRVLFQLEPSWMSEQPSYRDRTRRLVRLARRYAQSFPAEWLDGRIR